MKPLLLVATLLVSASLRAAPASSFDPFAPGRPSWSDEIVAAKPFTLEVCAAEVEATPTPDDPAELVTPEFLASAKRLRIAVAATDQGMAEWQDSLRVVYRLTPDSKDHQLEILATLRDADAGLREVNSKLTLFPDRWLVMGGFTRESVTVAGGVETTTKRNLVFAIRLSSAAPTP